MLQARVKSIGSSLLRLLKSEAKKHVVIRLLKHLVEIEQRLGFVE